MAKLRVHGPRAALRFLELAFGLVFLGAVAHHVLAFDFKPLAAFCIPILAVYYAFASLLFVRGRALPEGPSQIRSLYAAERAMQATIWHLLGIILGTAVYGFLRYLGITFDASEPSLAGLWLLLFLAPYALMQVGLLCFMRAIWVIARQFVREVGAFELRRRVHHL